MHVNTNFSWQHAVLSALVMSSAVSANYGTVHVRRGEHAVRDILPNPNAHALKERDLLSTLSGLLGGAGAGAGNDAADAAAGQEQAGKGQGKGQANEGAAGAGEAAAGQDDEEDAQGEAAQGEAAQGEAAQGGAAQGDDAEADDEEAEGQGKGQGSTFSGKTVFDNIVRLSSFRTCR
jgi:hypothetical protein